MLPSHAIQEFKRIYHEEFGEKLTEQVALKLATRTLDLFRVVYRPIPSKKAGDADENKNQVKHQS